MHPKNREYHLAGRFHRLRLLWSLFAFKNPLFWLFLCLWSVMMHPCFVYGYVSTQKLFRIATEKHQNSLKVDHTIVFILLWEQTRQPSCQDLFHTQFLVQNSKHCTLRYACDINYFAHFDSSITQNHIMGFVYHFKGSHFHWTSRTIFIFCGCTRAGIAQLATKFRSGPIGFTTCGKFIH